MACATNSFILQEMHDYNNNDLHRIDNFFQPAEPLELDSSEVFDGDRTVAGCAPFLGAHRLQPAPLALQVPAGDVQHRGVHL